MSDASYKDYVLDQLKQMSGVGARAMFGGFGIYKSGTMFGLIAGDELYFKVDDSNRPDFEARKAKPFVYQSAGRKPVSMSYWRVPDEILEDGDELKTWAMKAYDVALKAKKASGAKPKPRRAPRNMPRPPRRR
ncbi:MAG: TfoX/Sxy family protein [Rhodobacteraceae bacterium]|nr:TfoX/Sxy family protein [Paracoccaceae bacterium]